MACRVDFPAKYIMPLAYEDTFDNAATTVVAALIEEIGEDFEEKFDVPLEAERTLVLDYLPPRIKVAAFFLGGGEAVAHSWHEEAPKEMVMAARFEARFASRSDARVFAMLVLSALPILQESNIVELRIAANPSIEADFMRLANDKGENLYWRVVVPCLCVFRTDGEFS